VVVLVVGLLDLLLALLAVRQGAVRELGQGKSARVAKTSAHCTTTVGKKKN
jgi:hypothetical protein